MEELTAGTGSERTPHQGSMEEQTAGAGSKQTLLPGDNTFPFYDHLDSLKNNPIVNIIIIAQYFTFHGTNWEKYASSWPGGRLNINC